MEILKFGDYEGSAELDMDRMVCVGKILFIDDVVHYEAEAPSQLQAAFEAAVTDYLETSEMLGRQPQKPLKGQFNVRVPREMHKAAALRAAKDEISLNEVVVRSLDAFLCTGSQKQNVTFVVRVDETSGLRKMISSTSTTHWEKGSHVTH